MTELITASEARRLAKEILNGETKKRLSNVAEELLRLYLKDRILFKFVIGIHFTMT